MMSDLVKNIKQLRDYSEGPTSLWGPICYAAADMLERQQHRIAELEHKVKYPDYVIEQRCAECSRLKAQVDEWAKQYEMINTQSVKITQLQAQVKELEADIKWLTSNRLKLEAALQENDE